ncbi:MAG TPA: hypothetical protein VFX51_19080 [Solirubrobacteraceae bacterium]|nr:hypothetical protein [Solirubrobacteraceae bacterium]
MHERVSDEPETRETPATAPPARALPQQPPAAMALQLQRTVGNRATAQMVQRWNPVTGVVGDVLGIGFDYVWRKFVQANRESGSYFNVPPEWRQLAIDYAHAAGGADAKFLEIGIKRLPSSWIGGWIIGQAGDGTHAITLDTDIFFNADMSDEPSVDTYVHELVHVAQYAIEGVEGFLGDYAVDFVEGYVTGGFDDMKAYHSIKVEQHAAAVEARFKAWREQREKEEAAKPKPAKPKDPLEEAQEKLKPPSPISEFGGFSLAGSVGQGGVNRPEDVERVAGRLHGLGFLPTMTTDVDAVTDAIYDYQLRVFRWPRPDGRVDVENKTHRALKAGRKEGSMAL